MDWLLWSWLLPLPGLLLTATGVGRRPGVASLAGPPLIFLVALLSLLGGTQGQAQLLLEGWLPFLPATAFHLRADSLSALMLLAVGGVASMVYVYSLGYMAGDPGQRRFFVLLDFFVLAMSLLVLAGNLAVLLIGWTGVGIASFLLISFWRDRPGTLAAAVEALAANAIGDAALLLAAVLVPTGCGALDSLQTAQCNAGLGGATLLAALLVVAAAAKSAQGPLYFWLPSAMAGPTPVSALIHAATMVAAGVYLLVRVSPLLAQAPEVLLTTSIIGVATALLGGLASLWQSNFKRGLAYSTVSQLGYMFAGIGFGAPFAAFFHLFTHASFKALLFLAAGVVIHARQGEEELARLGGLRKALPAAYFAFLIGALSLIGFPGFAGSFSKDLLVEVGLERNLLLGGLLLLGALVTGLYIGRLFFAVFHGPVVLGAENQSLHHPEGTLLWPLLPLAIGALLLGYLEWPARLLSGALEPLLGHAEGAQPLGALTLATGGLGLVGFLAAGWWQQRVRPPVVEPRPGGKELSVAQGADWVRALASGGYWLARCVSRLHSGQLARYAFLSLVGVAAILLVAVRG